jgi:hypothetical protein
MPFRALLLFIALAALSVAAYVGLSATGGSIGFPLDDAWIHQTYARNLAESGQLAFVAGQPSAGSTSPLWTLLIAAGYKLGVDYRLWTYALGALSLALCGWFAARLSLRLWPDRPRLAWAAGLLCLFEWRLGWAAASGMETVLFAALGLALIEQTSPPAPLLTTKQLSSGEGNSDARSLPQHAASLRERGPGGEGRDGAVFGALGGLLTVTRPEGVLLVALAGLARLIDARVEALAGNRLKARLRTGVNAIGNRSRPDGSALARFYVTFIAAFGLFVFPAVWLNLQAGGAPFPNTFYAKQQEYAAYFASFAAWLPRALDVIGAPFVGAQLLLAPGLLLETLGALRRRAAWPRLLPIAWIAAHLAVYAARLPATYQHGRYLMPIIPAIILVGLHGSAQLLERIGQERLLRRVGVGSLVAATAAFWLIGAGAYRVDVNVVEREVVASARWIETHTPPDALIAAHDIGAIGYFARRPLLDLAGLISPDVIPIIRDEPALRALLRARRADYLAAPPDFYTTLLDAPELARVFEGASPFAPKHWLVFRAEWQSP